MSQKKYIDFEGLKHYHSLLLKEKLQLEERIEEVKKVTAFSLNDLNSRQDTSEKVLNDLNSRQDTCELMLNDLSLNPTSEIPDTIILEEDGIYLIKDNSVYPVSHPDLSTQPSILPQRFGNLDIKEVLIANGRENEIPNDATVITAFSFNNHLCCAAIVEKKDNIWSIKNEHDIIPEFTLIQYIGSDKGYYYYSSGEEQTQEQEIEITPARYLTFKAQVDNSSLGLERLATNHKVYYSKDNTHWKKLNKNINILLNSNEEVYIIGDGEETLFSSNDYTLFKMTGNIEIYGDITSIIDYSTTDKKIKDYCYYQMFLGCTSLVTAPELPATTLAESCYAGMFYGCTNLVTAPELPATTLAYCCYQSMFLGCKSLVTAPELPATTLASYCYYSMFLNCSSLVTAPELPATTLAYCCYQSMFLGCKSLNSITCLATNISATGCTINWVTGVSSSGTFTKAASMSSWTIGKNGIPASWTVQDY